MGLITGYTDTTAVTSDDRMLGLDGGATKLIRPDDVVDYVSTGISGTYVAQATTRTVTVGAAGDYSTLSAALIALSAERPLVATPANRVTISLLTGFTLAEQIKLQDVDLSWITITSVDAEVPITSENIPAGEGAFWAVQNARLPVIGCLFRFNTSGDVRATPALRGFDILRGSVIIFDAGGGIADSLTAKKCNRMVEIAHGSVCVATSGLIAKDGNDIGVRVSNSSILSAPSSTITNNTNNGVAAASGSVLQLNGSTITGSLTNIVTTDPATIVAPSCTLTGATNYAASIVGGSANLNAATITGKGVDAHAGAIVDVRSIVKGASDPLNANTGAIIVSDSGALTQLHSTQGRVLVGCDVNTAALTFSASQIQFTKFMIEQTMTFDRIVIAVGTSAGNIDVGVYGHDGANDRPNLSDSKVRAGSTACPAAGRAEVTVTSTTLSPGVYWFAYVSDSASTGIGGDADAGRLAGSYRLVSTFPLPTSGTPTGRTDAAICFALQKS